MDLKSPKKIWNNWNNSDLSPGFDVPFRDLKDLDGATLRTMTAAYDAAIAKLGIEPTDPKTSALAAKIVAIAQKGCDPQELCERALAELDH